MGSIGFHIFRACSSLLSAHIFLEPGLRSFEEGLSFADWANTLSVPTQDHQVAQAFSAEHLVTIRKTTMLH